MKLIQVIIPAIPASLAICLAVQHQALLRRTGENQILEQQVRQMNDIAARNAQLSNLLARASVPEELPRDQMLELLRLRSQVGALRRQQIGLDNAREENRQAHAVLDRYFKTLAETNPVATADYWPRAAWTNSGYGSPEAALQTALWAGYNGDVTNFLASMDPQSRDDFETNQFKGQSEAEKSARIMDEMYNIHSIQILGRQALDDNTVSLTVEMESQDSFDSTGMLMKKIDGEWKFVFNGPPSP